MSGETTVGSIVGFLRLDIKDFEAGIARARAMADNLGRKDIDIRVKVDTAGAAAKLGAVDAAAKKTDGSVRSLDKSTNNMGRSARFLVGVLLTVGPALIPLAAATIGLAAGFGTMGAAGILAIVGIRKEMAAGTTMGKAYKAEISTLSGDLTRLGHTAAGGVLQPFQESVASLQQRMPVLNSLIGEFSAISGRTAGTLMTGIVAAFVALAPLSRDASMYIYGLSQRFTQLMSGPGVVSFGDYVRSVFPHVMQQFESIVGAVLRLVAAFAPFGTGVLTLIGAFADAINAIPVDVLSVIATGGLAIFLGFKTFSLLSMPIHEVGVAMRFMGASTEFAATAMRGLSIAAGVIGAIIAIATIAYTAHSESVRNDQQAVNDLTDALIRGHGAIEADTVAERANALAKDGTLAAAKLLGLNLGDVTAASLGNADATARLNARTTELESTWKTALEAAGRSPAALKGVTDGLKGQYDALTKVDAATKSGVHTLDLAKQAYDAYNAATAKAATGGSEQAAAQQALAARIGTTAAALALAADGQTKTADAAALATAKMYLENDAAGLLKATLDLLNGRVLGLEQAKTADALATNQVTAALKANGTAIAGNTDKAIANQQALQNKASASQREAEAVAKATGSTVAGTAAYLASKGALEDELRSKGLLTAKVQAYIDKLYDLKNLKVPPTKLDVDKAAAAAKIKALQAEIASLQQHGKPRVDVNTDAAIERITRLQQQLNALQGKGATTGVPFHIAKGSGGSGGTTRSDGGPITGVGGPREDNIPLWGSVGEFMVNAKGYAKYPALVEAINADKFADGGPVGGQRLAGGGSVNKYVVKTPKSSGSGGSSSSTKHAAAKQIWTVGGKQYASASAAHNASVSDLARQARAVAAAVKALATTQREYQYTYLPSFVKALSGTTSALTTAGSSLIAHVAKTAAAHQMSASMIVKLSAENASLGKLASSRDSITTQIKSANDALTEAQKTFADQQASVTSSLGAVDLSKSSSPTELIAQLTDKIKAAKEFGSQIGTLKGEGLNADMLKQLADAGPSTGADSPLAQMMGATPSQIGQINTLMAQLQTTAATTGTSIATSLYGSGVSAAQGLVAGLESQQKAIEAQMLKIATAMQSAIKKALGIKSPSTVMRGLGRFTGQGFALGITDTHAGTRRAAMGMASAAVPRIHMPAGSMDSASSAARASAIAGASGDGMLSVTIPVTVMANDRVLFDVVRTVSIDLAKKQGTSGLKL